MCHKKPSKIKIAKSELRKFIEQNRSTEVIARHYKVSSRTISRRINDFGLKGVRPKGRKPKKKPS